jgi:hypothetical protein
MSGGRVVLAIQGIQDEYLTGSPEVTYFLKKFSRHTKFALATLDNVFDDNVVDFGDTVTCTVPNNRGDLIRQIYVRLRLSALSTADTHGTGYTDSITHAMIEYAELLIGGQTVERITGEFIETFTDMFVSDSHQNGIKYTEGVTGTKLGLGPASTTVATGEFGVYPRTFTVALPFYFLRETGLALPLVALTKQPVEVRIKFRPLRELIVAPETTTALVAFSMTATNILTITTPNTYIRKGMTVSGTGVVGTPTVLSIDGTQIILSTVQTILGSTTLTFGFPVSSTLLEDTVGSITKATLPIEYVFLSENERNMFRNTNLTYIITQLQLENNEILPNQTSKVARLNFLNPVREMFFIIQNREMVESNVYTGNDWFNYHNPEDITAPNNEQLESLSLDFNGESRIRSEVADAQFLGVIQPMNAHTRTPRRVMYNYSFALQPEMSDPTGQVNMSRIVNKLVTVNTTANTKHRDLRVYARAYNILKIQNGLAGVIFNSTL